MTADPFGRKAPEQPEVPVVSSGEPPETDVAALRRELAELRAELVLADGQVLTGQDGHGTHVESVDDDGNGTGHLTAVVSVHAEAAAA